MNELICEFNNLLKPTGFGDICLGVWTLDWWHKKPNQ